MKNTFFYKLLTLILPFSLAYTWTGDFYISSSANSWPDLNASIGSGWKFSGSDNNGASGSVNKILTLSCVNSPSSEGEIGSGTFYFRIIHKEGSNWHSWGGSGSDVSLTLDSPTETITHDNSWSTSGSKTFTATVGKTYKILLQANPGGSGGTSAIGVYEFSSSPTSITSVSNVPNGTSTSNYAVTVGLSGTPATEEAVYIRYSIDNWSSANVVEADPNSNSVSINIPGQSAGTTVRYYAFNSVSGISNANADKATVSINNNSGNNYSYYVETGNLRITGDGGFRMLSSPVAGQVLGNLLTNAWTQGMTGADITSDNANVWTFNVSGQSWTALSDISGSGTSVAAGQGFLTYVFADNNNDGTDDLPITLSVSGSENSGSATYPASGSIAANAWGLAGNPYYSTIDWDDVTKTNVTSTIYVWDDATSAYKSWNGSSGGLTNGLIAPFQGFWVQANGSGSGSITIETADKSSSAGTFYRIADIEESGSLSLTFTSIDNNQDIAWFSFTEDGAVHKDDKDAYKLLPLAASSRIAAMSYNDEHSLDINNLPFLQDQAFEVPVDVMSLEVEEGNFITTEKDITVSWDITDLPIHAEVILIDQVTGTQINIRDQYSYTFTTQPKGSFSTNYNGPVGTYPVVGEARFSLAVSYDALTNGGNIKVLPAEFALHAAYPNPFNPSTTISFDLPETGKVSLSVYDLKGALVGTLLNESKVAGTYQYRWTPNSDLASGMYLFKLKTKNKTRHQKITFIK